MTSSEEETVSSTEVERKCTELMKVCDQIIETARESDETDASETVKALLDGANTRKMEKQRDGE